MVEQAIPGGVHLSTAAYERLLERLAQAEAKVRAVEAAMAAFEKDVANPGASWVNTGMRALYNFRAALSGDAAPRTDGDTR